MHHRTFPLIIGILCSAIFINSELTVVSQAETVVLGTSKDNTLIENGDGSLSNGLGPLFAGKTGGGGPGILRSLMAFDIASEIPAGSIITDVELTLNITQVGRGAGNDEHGLHAVDQDWGEGTSSDFGGKGADSTTGDATWIHTFFDGSSWTTPGGDFNPTPSATQILGAGGLATWESTSSLVADVQNWLDNPAANFGWILIGNEIQGASARKFASRDDGLNPPQLTVSFVPEPGSLALLLLGSLGSFVCNRRTR